MVPLQKPDFQILQWSVEDVSSSTDEAKILGAPLQKGIPLHKDLQRTYLTDARNHVKDELKIENVSHEEKDGMQQEGSTLQAKEVLHNNSEEEDGYVMADIPEAQDEDVEASSVEEVAKGMEKNFEEDGYVDVAEAQDGDHQTEVETTEQETLHHSKEEDGYVDVYEDQNAVRIAEGSGKAQEFNSEEDGYVDVAGVDWNGWLYAEQQGRESDEYSWSLHHDHYLFNIST